MCQPVLQIITGVLLWDVQRFHPIMELMGGVRVVDAFHIVVGYVFASFQVVHVSLSTLGRTFFSYFKTMIVGYEGKETADVVSEEVAS